MSNGATEERTYAESLLYIVQHDDGTESATRLVLQEVAKVYSAIAERNPDLDTDELSEVMSRELAVVAFLTKLLEIGTPPEMATRIIQLLQDDEEDWFLIQDEPPCT